tara:strand:+ start:3602 stop:3934 length:333 start_codon:yes stop_codon:yes gene_type:complete
MGADVFYNRTKGNDAKVAFREELEEARYMSGHGGYTGTIAEKSGFVMSNKPKGIDADEWIEMVSEFDEEDKKQENYHALKKDYETYDNKWEGALCVPTKDGFIFCGWASS